MKKLSSLKSLFCKKKTPTHKLPQTSNTTDFVDNEEKLIEVMVKH